MVALDSEKGESGNRVEWNDVLSDCVLFQIVAVTEVDAPAGAGSAAAAATGAARAEAAQAAAWGAAPRGVGTTASGTAAGATRDTACGIVKILTIQIRLMPTDGLAVEAGPRPETSIQTRRPSSPTVTNSHRRKAREIVRCMANISR